MGAPRLKAIQPFFPRCSFSSRLLWASCLLVSASLAAQEPVTGPPQRKSDSTTTPTPQQAGGPQAQGRDRNSDFFGLGGRPDPQAVDRGQKLFVGTCGFCHGSTAVGGNSGPNLVRSVLVLHDEGTGKEIGPVVLNGRVDKGMPKFALSEAQIKDIAQFLLSRTQAAIVRQEYKTLNIVTGNAEAGKEYFAAHCTSCHSATGDLAHVGSKFEPEQLQSRFLYPETRRRRGSNPGALSENAATVKVTSRNGQSYEGTLVYLDDFNVVMRDKNGENRSWSRDEPGLQVHVQDPLQGHADLLPQYTDADMHNLLAYLVTLK